MEVSVRELKTRLSHYLRLAHEGEPVLVTSHNRPVARLTACDATVDNLPTIPGVRWKTNPPGLTRPVTERPKVEGMPVSDWVVANRR